MIIDKIGYAYNDLTIVPDEISGIKSRSECNPYTADKMLPIFTAPMSSVVSEHNYEKFINTKITPIIPRSVPIETRMELAIKGIWIALSLNEAQEIFVKNAFYLKKCDEYRICIDVANGHMEQLYNVASLIKDRAAVYDKTYTVKIMVGNIANPDTYKYICLNRGKAVDYIRVGIGSGAGCITSSNASIHYPQASLIDEIYKIKANFQKYHASKVHCPKIVADGGIRNYSDVIKALALGADYVMIGGLFSQCIESAGMKLYTNGKAHLRFPVERYKDFKYDVNGNWSAYYTDEAIRELSKSWSQDEEAYRNRINELKVRKSIGKIDVKFFGMASADGQRAISGKKTKTSEGVTKILPVTYQLSKWSENMAAYLRSAMSYTNAYSLDQFQGKVTLIPNSISEIQSVNK